MSFKFPELILESVIRDGLANMKNNEKVINDVFGDLKQPFLDSKYGEIELNRIKSILMDKKEVAVVHNLSDVGMKVPCFSIQLGVDAEDQQIAGLGDHSDVVSTPITDIQDLNALIRADLMVITSYDSKTGKIVVSDPAKLTNVKISHQFIDASGTKFSLKGINKVQGVFFIDKLQSPDISDFTQIVSTLNVVVHEEEYVPSKETIIIGVHAKDSLMAKYLYILLKYFMVSRKSSFHARGFSVSSFSGSDFTRNMKIQGDQVYNRFLTITGKITDSWNAGDVEQIEEVQVTVLVPKDEASASDLNQESLTTKTST